RKRTRTHKPGRLGVRVPPDVLIFIFKNHPFILMREKIINFFSDIYKEMQKVTWQKQDELIESTKVVLIACLIFTVIVWVIDIIVTEILKVIF
ncbi:MAG: preprotein translocase subunit SecE, partial [Candidatus Kryptonium sp.]